LQFVDKYANKSGQAVQIQALICTDCDNAVDRARLLWSGWSMWRGHWGTAHLSLKIPAFSWWWMLLPKDMKHIA